MSDISSKLRKIREYAKELSETIPTTFGDHVDKWMEKVKGLCESCDKEIIKDNIPVNEMGAFKTAVNWLREHAGACLSVGPSTTSKVKPHFEKLLSSLDAAQQSVEVSSHFIDHSQSEEKQFHKSNGISQNHEESLEEKNGDNGRKIIPWFKENWKLTLILVFLTIIVIIIMIISLCQQQRAFVPIFEKLFNSSERENSSVSKDGKETPHEDESASGLKSTVINDLAIKVGYGDRHAFEELRLIASSNGSEESIFAKKVIAEIIKKYSGKMYLEVTINTEVPNYIVVEALNDINPDTRKMAIYTVNKRKLYSEIPTLISMIKSEEDLDVLAAIYRTLNNLLPTKVSMFQEDADSIFQIALNKKCNTNP